MTTYASRILPLIALTTLAALSCGGSNPHQIWLALNGSERAVQLVDHDPGPF